VNDQEGSPAYANDLAKVILKIIASSYLRNENWMAGIYHYSNEGVISWYHFALAIKELTGSSCVINPILTSSYPTPAKRPAYSVFSKEKIKSTYNIFIPPWRESLKNCITKMVI
jgi:dTDP-4-dehydrorhamnose reductase